MIITISGTGGSGKSSVAKILAKKLNIKRYSMGDLTRKLAEEKGMSLEEFNKMRESSDTNQDKMVDDYQTELSEKEDNFIIDGRLSWHFIKKSIKIFLDAELAIRAERVFQDNKWRKSEQFTDIEDAKNKLEERNRCDYARYKKHYNVDYLDTANYDLVIDTSNISAEQVADKIIEFAKSKQ